MFMGLGTMMAAGASAPAAPSYPTLNAVEFSGDDKYTCSTLLVTNNVSVFTNQTCSFWYKYTGGSTTTRTLLHHYSASNVDRVIVQIDANQRLYVYQGNGTDRVKFTTTNPLPTDSNWHHVVFSFAQSGSIQANCRVYVDGVKQPLTFTVYAASSGGAGQFYWNIGAGRVDNYFQGGIAQFLWTISFYLDLDVEANLRKFISADGHPVDFGTTGTIPLGGVQPMIYLNNPAATFGTNNNGNFAAGTSTLTDISPP